MGEVFRYANNDRAFPMLAKWFPGLFKGPLKELHANYMKRLFEETIAEHRANSNPDEPPRVKMIELD